MKMDVRGEFFAPTGPEGREVRRPFTSSARFDFLEAAPESSPPDGPPPAAARHGAVATRHFFSAFSQLSIGDATTRRGLRDALTTLAVVRRPAVRHFAIDAYLTPDEIELLALPFDPLLLDGLLPNLASEEASGEVPAEWVAAALGIDTIGRPAEEEAADAPAGERESTTIRSRLIPAEEPGQPNRVAISGSLQGAVDGVPTGITVEGLLTLDADGLRVAQAVVQIRERRLAGHVSPGFECDATIQMARRPAEESQAVPAAGKSVVESLERLWERLHDAADPATTLAVDPTRGTGPGDPDRAWTTDSKNRFAVIHDVRWRGVADDARGLVLRLVDDGALLAECTVSPLGPSPAGNTVSLADFRRDVERSLGDKLLGIKAETAKTRADGLEVARIVSEGAAGQLPLEWRHHLLSSPGGDRVSVTFMVERRFLERFGDADNRFVEGLSLPKAVEP